MASEAGEWKAVSAAAASGRGRLWGWPGGARRRPLERWRLGLGGVWGAEADPAFAQAGAWSCSQEGRGGMEGRDSGAQGSGDSSAEAPERRRVCGYVPW